MRIRQLRKGLLAFLMGTAWTMGAAQTVFINEIHYDDASGDSGEGVEVAGPAGTDLTGWIVQPYNGAGGATYTPLGTLSGLIPDQGGGYGTVFVAILGLQNGAPDGLALVNASSVVVQFLSYEGSFVAVGGPANGMASTDIGVSEPGTVEGQSLQLTGTGTTYTDFTWVAQATSTYGAFNNGQTFGATCGISVQTENATCNSTTVGDLDTYDLSIPYTGLQAGITVVNNSGSGTVSGDDPALINSGTILITGIAETDNYSVTFTAPCNALTVSGSAPGCDPILCGIAVGGETATCNTFTPGLTDTYDLSIPYTGVQAGITVVNNSGSGTVGGDDPAVTNNGTIVISGISEADAYSVTFTAPCDALVVSGSAPACDPPPSTTIVINEVDADQTGTDQGEFVELYGPANESLTGMVLVFWNGAGDISYFALDLDGQSLDANGFWVAGNTAVPNVDLTFADNFLQQGADAVALYFGDATSFPNSTALTVTGLIDAVVYDTDDADDAGLLALTPGQPQVNENGGANGTLHSNSRVPDGGTQLNTTTYVQQVPTPGATNVSACGITPQAEVVQCTTFNPGPGDTYSVTIPYLGVQPGTAVVNNSGSGSVGGDDPATVSNGTIVISGISDANAYSITFTAPCNTLTVSGSAPSCEPLPEIVINEVDYDQPGNDTEEFIELKNTGLSSIDLAGYTLQLVNGNLGGAAVYQSYVLPSFLLAPGGYYVICTAGSSVPNCNLQVTLTAGGTVQNGAPDAIGLRDPANNLVDAVSYEGNAGAPYTEVSGALLLDPGSVNDTTLSIGRIADGTDTDNNDADFQLNCVHTPGAANVPSVDTDGDLAFDCADGCPLDPLKTAPGTCGCGVPDDDSDFDGFADCIDGCPFDVNKIVPGQCGCGNPDTDSDGDFIADCVDICPGFDDNLDADFDGLPDGCDSCPLVAGEVGDPCDDLNPFTANDTLSALCNCVGTPVPCDNWTLDIVNFNNAGTTSWQIIEDGTANLLDSGGPYPNGSSTTETIWVPQGLCWDLILTDTGADGMASPGGWILKDNNGKRVLDNTAAGDGTWSTAVPDLPFCNPVGSDGLIIGSCDKMDWLITNFIVANPNAAVSAEWLVGDQSDDGYQFWFQDPEGGYTRRILRNHATSGGFGPPSATRACHLKLSSMVTLPLPYNTLLNVRVRSLVNGVYADFGPACRFMLLTVPPACPTTQLDNNPLHIGTTYSCGVSGKVVNASGSTGKLWANPAPGATHYKFQFEILAEGYLRNITTTSYTLVLGPWLTNPLLCGTFTYDVRVGVSVDGGANFCPFGPTCTVGITNSAPNPCTAPFQGGGQHNLGAAHEAGLHIYPNPNRGDLLSIMLTGIPQEVQVVRVDIHDVFGKQVITQQITTGGGDLNHVMQLGSSLSDGLYMVTLTVAEKTYSQRLIIQ